MATIKRQCAYGTLALGVFTPCLKPATHIIRDGSKPFLVEPACAECKDALCAENPKLTAELI